MSLLDMLLLNSSHAVYTLDAHQPANRLISLSSARFFAKYTNPSVVVALDSGAKRRCVELATIINQPVLTGAKLRTDTATQVTFRNRKMPEDVIVYDDLIDSGESLRACVDALHGQGVKGVQLCVAHQLKAPRFSEKIHIKNILETALSQDPQALTRHFAIELQNVLKRPDRHTDEVRSESALS